MAAAFIVRFRPNGPWRIGTDTGARDRTDRILHSDQLYSALTLAMQRLGMFEKWLEDVFENPDGPAVRLSSCFPWREELLFVPPPRCLWPLPSSVKVRWKGAGFVPLAVVHRLASGESLDEDAWVVDGLSKCLVPSSAPRGPFRTAYRSFAGVDRTTSQWCVHSMACLEFSERSGFWAVVAFENDEAMTRWGEPVKAALRLLADSGMGGKRSIGWGCAEMVEFLSGSLPEMIFPQTILEQNGAKAEAEQAPENAFWLLSLFNPSDADAVDWSRGFYSLITRTGRVESPAACGAMKKATRMVAEGSVLFSSAPLRGRALNVAPEGCPHPVYRAGFGLAISIPWRTLL